MSIAEQISVFNRQRKLKELLDILHPTEKTTILDVGFSEEEYSPGENFIEKRYAWPAQITALGTDMPDKFLTRYPLIKAVQYDGYTFPFEDQSFDICVSNAVIEHVGNHELQVHFLKELKRVGKKTFFTTPNLYFPVEVHTRTLFLHWLPGKLFERYLLMTGKKWATNGYMNLLSKSKIKKLLKEAGIKEYRIIRNRYFLFVMDFVVIF